MSSVSETHLPFERPEDTEYLLVLGHVLQLLHKGTRRWDCLTALGLNSDLL